MTTQTISREMQECIEACRECQKCCAALERSGGVDSKTIQTAKNCGEICQTCTSFVTGESRFTAEICNLCAQVCKACAAACDKISAGSIAKECAIACRRCAETCRNVNSPVQA